MRWLWIAAMLAMPAACDGFGAYCQALIDCEKGNADDIEACEISQEAEADRAAVYGCATEFDTMADCIEEQSECQDDFVSGFYTAESRCSTEQSSYAQCLPEDAQ